MDSCFRIAGLVALAALMLPLLAPRQARAEGLIAKDDYFPMCVWLQNPSNAGKYKAVGINVYVGLYDGPTAQQLSALRAAGVTVACAQNEVSLDSRWSKVVVGWLQNDEPDNAQEKKGGGYGPPIMPAEIVRRYEKMKTADPLHRPVMLNLGMGVAWDNWFGRGVRTRKPEDYPQYAKGGDIISFDIYPASADSRGRSREYAGKLSFVGSGVKRLVNWVDNKKPVFTCIETTHISNPEKMATPRQIHDEVWMAIINGARGIIYFAHEFKPKFIEAGLLSRPEIAVAVKNTNAQVESLARFINNGKPVEGASADAKSITFITRKLHGETCLFATCMEAGPVKAAFILPGIKPDAIIEVLGEDRRIQTTNGKWSDTFTGYEAHLYHVAVGAAQRAPK